MACLYFPLFNDVHDVGSNHLFWVDVVRILLDAGSLLAYAFEDTSVHDEDILGVLTLMV